MRPINVQGEEREGCQRMTVKTATQGARQVARSHVTRRFLGNGREKKPRPKILVTQLFLFFSDTKIGNLGGKKAPTS